MTGGRRIVALAALAAALGACGGGPDHGDDGAPRPAESADTTAAETTEMTVGPPCETMTNDPDRLDLVARWEDDQVRVSGTIAGGAGNALSLGLSQQGRFVYDRVFKADLMGVMNLERDAFDQTSVTNEPSASERAAFSRTGARPFDPALPLCVDVLLYERGSLDRLAERHFLVEGAPPSS